MRLSKLVYQIATDPDFAALFDGNSAEAHIAPSSSITADEIRALHRILRSSQLRTQLLSLDQVDPDIMPSWVPLTSKPSEA